MLFEVLEDIHEAVFFLEALSKARREKLLDKDFAIPERRAWPIQSLKQAKIAMNFMKRKLGNPKEYARIKAAIIKRYPKLKVAVEEIGRKKKI
jgi:hypothetical protein